MSGSNKAIHTLPNKSENDPSKKWINKREGSDEILSFAATKRVAQSDGRKIAKSDQVEHIIHKLDGTIGSRNSYGNDPESSKG